MHRNREAMIAMRVEWKRDGYCTRCGKEPVLPARTRGPLCIFADWLRRNNIVALSLEQVHHST